MTAQLPPTPPMARCLAAIERLTVDDVSPTYDLLAAELGAKSKSGINRLLTAMRERGLVTFSHVSRSIRVTPLAANVSELPTKALMKLQGDIEAELIARAG